MTWMLQAAVVLAVPLTLLGTVWLGVRLLRVVRANRSASARNAIGLHLQGELLGFRGWLADLIDGASEHDTSTDCGASADADGDACDGGSD